MIPKKQWNYRQNVCGNVASHESEVVNSQLRQNDSMIFKKKKKRMSVEKLYTAKLGLSGIVIKKYPGNTNQSSTSLSQTVHVPLKQKPSHGL